MNARGKILLVDDDPDFLEMHKAVLQNHGYEVLTAMSGREGLERVRAEMPDLIILDLMMEQHDAGFSFSKPWKTDPRLRKFPILTAPGAGSGGARRKLTTSSSSTS